MEPQVSPINRLPPELLVMLFESLEPEGKTLCVMTCQRWRELIKDLWPNLKTRPYDVLHWATKLESLSLIKFAKRWGATSVWILSHCAGTYWGYGYETRPINMFKTEDEAINAAINTAINKDNLYIDPNKNIWYYDDYCMKVEDGGPMLLSDLRKQIQRTGCISCENVRWEVNSYEEYKYSYYLITELKSFSEAPTKLFVKKTFNSMKGIKYCPGCAEKWSETFETFKTFIPDKEAIRCRKCGFWYCRERHYDLHKCNKCFECHNQPQSWLAQCVSCDEDFCETCCYKFDYHPQPKKYPYHKGGSVCQKCSLICTNCGVDYYETDKWEEYPCPTCEKPRCEQCRLKHKKCDSCASCRNQKQKLVNCCNCNEQFCENCSYNLDKPEISVCFECSEICTDCGVDYYEIGAKNWEDSLCPTCKEPRCKKCRNKHKCS